MAGSDAVDELHALPAAEFVAARDALAKELRAGGDREEAARVKALPRPTRAAAAVNHLVRAHPDAVAALAEAAEAVAGAQGAALGGGGGAGLREATAAARDRVAALVDLLPGGEPGAVREAVQATLHAAVVDPDVLADVRAGRLSRERAASGFGGVAAVETDDAPRATPKAKAKAKASKAGTKASKADREREGREREEQRERERAEAEERAARERAVAAAEQAAAAADAEVEARQEALDRAEAALDEARGALRDAKRGRTRARRALRSAS